ncbi:MAG: hypothetical protein V5A64_05730 [Candidatus Thermoplasmatota archaeon]
MKATKLRKKLLTIAVLILFLNMIFGTQYAVTKVRYEYYILHPCETNIRYIGSDNASDGKRMLRVEGDNVTNIRIKLFLGKNFTTNQQNYYSAAFGIVNEQKNDLKITHINVTSNQSTYLRIWLHGDRDANANNTNNDNSSVLMWDNETMVNASNTTAWTLATGDGNTSNMCYNISDRTNCSIPTPWDETAHVRYSMNDNNAVSGLSDFVWIQIAVDIPEIADSVGLHTGTVWVHLQSEG